MFINLCSFKQYFIIKKDWTEGPGTINLIPAQFWSQSRFYKSNNNRVRMSLIVSSSRYYCPGPGQVQYESCPQCSFINVQWHVVVFIIFWTLLYYEKDIMSWSAGIANMSPIPKVIIPSFSWIMVFCGF